MYTSYNEILLLHTKYFLRMLSFTTIVLYTDRLLDFRNYVVAVRVAVVWNTAPSAFPSSRNELRCGLPPTATFQSRLHNPHQD